MTEDYSAPGSRLRSFGAGILTGDSMAGGDLMNRVQSNIQFRIESARSMLMGGDLEESVSPMERRQQIRERRLGAIRGNEGASPNQSAGMGGGSGQIGEAGRSDTGNDTSTRKDSTPSMSEVNAGTKKRAQDRGFGN